MVDASHRVGLARNGFHRLFITTHMGIAAAHARTEAHFVLIRHQMDDASTSSEQHTPHRLFEQAS